MGHDDKHSGKHEYGQEDELIPANLGQYGVAEYGSDGKIPTEDLPDAIVGAMQYQGTWDASTGAYPTAFDTGYYWVVSVAGTISGTDYEIGDWIVNNGDDVTPDWQKIDNSDKVSSVDSRTGAVTLNDLYADISHGSTHTDGTDDIQDATAAQKGLATATQITKLDGIEAGADVTGDNPPQSHDNTYHTEDYQTATEVDADIATHAGDANAHHTPPTLPGDIENGGTSEMSVAGLSGELADPQPPKDHTHDDVDLSKVEGTEIASTGETGGTKYLREDGDGTCSWQTPSASDPTAIHDDTENEINSIATSLTPADSDVLIAEDADAGTAWSKAKLTMSALYNYIKGKTDLLYAGITHAATHQDGGSDEINVDGLSGELADPQKVEILSGSQEAEFTTTQTTFQQAFRYSPTLEVAKYMVVLSAEYTHSDNITGVYGRVEIDDTTEIMSASVRPAVGDEFCPRGCVYVYDCTSAGVHDFDFDIRRIGVNGTSKIRRMRITLTKVVV